MPADQRPAAGSTTNARAGSPRRRSVLVATAALPALVAAGCSLRVGQPPAAAAPTGPTPDERARARAAADAESLGVLATSAVAAVPSAASQLRTIAQEHEAHVVALRLAVATATSPTPASTPASTGSSRPTSGRASLQALAARERLGVTAIEADLASVSPDLARLLASVAACRQVHVTTLGQLAARVSP